MLRLIYTSVFLLLLACAVAPASEPLCITKVIDLTQDSLALFYLGDDQRPLRSFQQLQQMLAKDGKRLSFVMNAGMFHPDRSPVGL